MCQLQAASNTTVAGPQQGCSFRICEAEAFPTPRGNFALAQWAHTLNLKPKLLSKNSRWRSSWRRPWSSCRGLAATWPRSTQCPAWSRTCARTSPTRCECYMVQQSGAADIHRQDSLWDGVPLRQGLADGYCRQGVIALLASHGSFGGCLWSGLLQSSASRRMVGVADKRFAQKAGAEPARHPLKLDIAWTSVWLKK